MKRSEDDAMREAEASSAAEPEAGEGGSALRSALKLFGTGVVGGVVTWLGLGGFGATVPTHHCHGATRSLEQRRAVRARCLELGVTPAELTAGGSQPTPSAAPRGAGRDEEER